jgi:enoyl-CoA hydratase
MNTVILDTSRHPVVVIKLNRPEVLNALSVEMISELHYTLDELAADPDIRAVILTGEGRGFCAGLDLKAFGQNIEAAGNLGPVQSGMEFQKEIAELIIKIRKLKHPVISAINGPASGGGLGLLLASDIRICSFSARFNAAFVRLGVSGCDVGVSYLLPKVVGPTLAFEMMLTGRLIDATEAERSGLVLKAFPDEDLLKEANKIAEEICSNSPFGVWMTKEVMWANLEAPSLERAIDLENRTQILGIQTEDSKEAAKAFIEKRKPIFKNR